MASLLSRKIPLMLLLGALALATLAAPAAHADSGSNRQAALDYARAAVAGLYAPILLPPEPLITGRGPWIADLAVYDRGAIIAQAQSEAPTPAEAIRTAVRQIPSLAPADFQGRMRTSRLFLRITSTDKDFSVVEYRGKALEIARGGDVTAVRSFDPRLLRQTIREQRNYLLRQMHPRYHGFFKRYDAKLDRADTDLRTIYTASTLWTLLLMNDVERDERIERNIRPIAKFLLTLQVKEGEHRGAFYYSRNAETGAKRSRLVVGTASKTIFTLLELHRRTGDRRYLDSAVLAGDWLVRQTQADGRVFAVVRKSPTRGWQTLTAQSVLYSGQTLTALSRLYQAVPKPEYKAAADRIATRLLEQARGQRFFVGDDFRPANTISTSWLAMAFLSYSRIEPAREYRDAVYRASRELLRYQIRDFSDILNDGRYTDTKASSGNGWMNEVLVDVYRQSVEDRREDGEIFLKAVTRTTRWLIQNVYSYENAYHIPNPSRALGGSIRDSVEESVRTDAVCHGGNSLIGYLQILKDDARYSIPE